jgi:hypothetical protein
MTASIFISAAITHEQIDETLRSAFQLAPDPMGIGWLVVAAPGRHIVVEDATDGTRGMPASILRRAEQNLGGLPIVTRLAVYEHSPDSSTLSTRSILEPSPPPDDLDFNTEVSIGGVFARTWPVAMDNHASLGWQQEPWLPGTDPSSLHAWRSDQWRSEPPKPTPQTQGQAPSGYETRPSEIPRRTPSHSSGSQSASPWIWRHRYLTSLMLMGLGALLSQVRQLYGLAFLLFLIGALPFGLKFLKWSFFLIFLGGGPSETKREVWQPRHWR